MRWDTMSASGGASQDSVGDGGTETRQRLRPWLICQLDSNNIPGLEWVDRASMTFKIPWKHGGKQDWEPGQAEIFKAWATHTGKFRAGIDEPNYAKWKTNLRCALNKAPDIKEMAEMTRKDEPNPYKVYRFLEKKNKRGGGIPINIPTDTHQYSESPATEGANLPTFIKDYTSSGSCPSGQKLDLEPIFGQPTAVRRPDLPEDRLPSDLGAVDSGDLMHMSDGGPRLSDALASEDQMDIEDNSGLDGTCTNNSPDSQSSYDCTPNPSPYNQVLLSPSHAVEAKYTPPWFMVPEIPSQQSNPQPIYTSPASAATSSSSQAANNIAVKPEALPPNIIPFDSLTPSHQCASRDGCDMYLEVLYRNHVVNSHHISSRTKGCRITCSALSNLTEDTLPDIFRDALFGPDSKQREVIELPEWPMGLCPQSLMPSILDLLKNMQRGLILECKHGDILSTRLCKTTVYYSSRFTSSTKKLVRHDDSIQVTKIFDMENDFKPALTKYDTNQGERPSPYVYLYIGQQGSESDLGSLLIVVRVTSCRALQLLNDVDEQRCHEYSMHISESNEYDHLGDCVGNQLNELV